MSDEFDWHDPSVVVRTQLAIAVYQNNHGEVVIRQEGQFGPDEEVFIVVAPANARAVAEAILREIGEEDRQAEPARLPATRDNTNAERQRRYRERQRQAESQQGNIMPLLAAE
jgi:hypothetical protein